MRLAQFVYVWKHKIQFLRTRNSNEFLKKYISMRTVILHDLGKSFNILIFGDEKATKIHRKFAGHHQRERMNFFQKVEAFCDWECARFTKPDKQLTGEETWKRLFPQIDMKYVVERFKELN